jgi:hypothetical protein
MNVMKATYLGYIFRTGVDMRPTYLILANWAMCPNMLTPDLFWDGFAVLPRDPPNTTNIDPAQPLLNMMWLCVTGRGHVPIEFFSCSGKNSAVMLILHIMVIS